MTAYVGTRAPRVDSVDKVTGGAVYANDLTMSGMLHGAVLRSPYPHARIVEIDVSRAQGAPGVEAVVTGKDFPRLFGSAIKDQPFLAIDRVLCALPVFSLLGFHIVTVSHPKPERE